MLSATGRRIYQHALPRQPPPLSRQQQSSSSLSSMAQYQQRYIRNSSRNNTTMSQNTHHQPQQQLLRITQNYHQNSRLFGTRRKRNHQPNNSNNNNKSTKSQEEYWDREYIKSKLKLESISKNKLQSEEPKQLNDIISWRVLLVMAVSPLMLCLIIPDLRNQMLDSFDVPPTSSTSSSYENKQSK